MARERRFGEKIAGGFATVAILAFATAGIAIYTVRGVVSASDRVVTLNAERMLDIAAMRVARERRAKHVRSYLLSHNEKYARQMEEARDELRSRLDALSKSAVNEEEKGLLDQVAQANSAMQAAWDEAIAKRRVGASVEEIAPHFERSAAIVGDLDQKMNAVYEYDAKLLEEARVVAKEAGDRANRLIVLAALAAAAAAAGFAWLLSRTLDRQIGSAVSSIQTSATELSSAARQQATSSKELAATTVEIATTTRQLLAMSRQISQSARRAAQTAEEAGDRARSGDLAVERAREAISSIQKQVAVIVDRMRSLGSKSQRVGGILELINELAEQTNILAINATIESSSAGEAGKRFAVVASEIRRLADRVGDSAREIHGLIEEIRRAAGATVSATDDGSRAVEAGTAQFGDVLSTFKHISERATVTAEVAREIELSIQQQTTAVEQVNHAIAEVAYATKEGETVSLATLDTSSKLVGISEELAAFVRTKREVERLKGSS